MRFTPPLLAGLISPCLLLACATPSAAVAPCTTYCATRDDGYQWAERANLLDAKACDAYSPAFTAGCREAVRDKVLSKNPQRAF